MVGIENTENAKKRQQQQHTHIKQQQHFFFVDLDDEKRKARAQSERAKRLSAKKRDTHEANREEKGVQGACIRGFVYYTHSNWNRIEDASVNAFRFISALLFLLRSLFVFHTRGPIWCVFEMHCNTMDVAGYFRHCLISLAHHVTLCAQEKKANAIDNLFV